MHLPFLLLCFTALSRATPTKRALNCKDITIPVSVSAQGRNLPATLPDELLRNYTRYFELTAGAPTALITNSYNISARYCAPTVTNSSRSTTLQFLVHGSTYTKDYWSGLAAPGTKSGQDQYSWVVYAANQGYPTLSIDRPCNGNSSHPNGLFNCQFLSNTEVVRTIAQLARSGSIPTVSTTFTKVIYVGHSYGSFIGNDLSVRYPTVIDSYILSGYSLNYSAITAPLAGPLPAFLVLPARFGFLAPDIFYLTPTNAVAVQKLFYYGNYDQAIFQYDYDNRGTTALSENFEIFTRGQLPAPSYTGSLFVLNGNQDVIVCSANPLNALLTVPGNCDNGFSSGVQSNYPGVRKFGFHNTQQSGHVLNNHLNAQESFKAAHDFLASDGL